MMRRPIDIVTDELTRVQQKLHHIETAYRLMTEERREMLAEAQKLRRQLEVAQNMARHLRLTAIQAGRIDEICDLSTEIPQGGE